jgi:Flp pilus assembly protein TadD
LEEARQAYTRLLEQTSVPNEIAWPVFQRLGLVYSQLGHDEAALDHMEKATIWAPSVAVNHRNLATQLMAMGRTGRAISEIREACDLEPGNWQFKLEQSQMLMAIGQSAPAKTLIEDAELITGRTNRINTAWARYYLDIEDYMQAQPYLEAIMEDSPSDEIRTQLALALLRNDEPKRSSNLLMPLWPDGLDTRGIRILLEADLATGGDCQGLQLVESIVKNGELQADSDFWATAALVSLNGGADLDALTLIDRAIAISPTVISYRHNRVIILQRLDRNEDADAEMVVIRNLDPTWSP